MVYGDVGTSPLYVFADVFSKVTITSEIDVLGALSIVIYTIALIPLMKYVFIVLKANDNGEGMSILLHVYITIDKSVLFFWEKYGLINNFMNLMAGGTFALYSLICRYANVNLLPNRQPADEGISSFKLKLPTPELERALNIKDALERKSFLKTILLLLVLTGTSMIIGDGILTPAMSGIFFTSTSPFMDNSLSSCHTPQVFIIVVYTSIPFEYCLLSDTFLLQWCLL